ncbi:PEPxxWA-CTERM sorting domain-containing protein [Sphingomonas sp.]|uniref:PEPxxWA-CTERM sorting domain-containing protein n=1 Tax=Sphingomonas sp. TaxID=28214 RepID=UPI0025E054BE|nr:PEPxxWA-CTERM sorting domain-containing protein [Sphingomonas sp.]
MAGAILLGSPATATNLAFTDFADTSALALNGSTATATDAQGRTVLRLTPALEGQAGSAYSLNPILLTGSYAFSTRFTFNINDPGGLAPADGFVFTIQPVSNSVGTGGSGIGIAGIAKSFGVEFDTFPAFGNDPATDHVAVDFGEALDINGDLASVATAELAAGYLSSGTDLTAWIDYDGATLEVRLGAAVEPRPLSALLSYQLDLASVIGGDAAYVGFTSATGSGYENHDIVSWQFNDSFSPISDVPEPATWAMFIGGFGLVGGAMRRRQRVSVSVA